MVFLRPNSDAKVSPIGRGVPVTVLSITREAKLEIWVVRFKT